MVELEQRFRSVEACIGILTSIAERQQDSIDSLKALAERHDDRIEEMRRDNRQTQRLWVRLCKKYGWLDDEDL